MSQLARPGARNMHHHGAARPGRRRPSRARACHNSRSGARRLALGEEVSYPCNGRTDHGTYGNAEEETLEAGQNIAGHNRYRIVNRDQLSTAASDTEVERKDPGAPFLTLLHSAHPSFCIWVPYAGIAACLCEWLLHIQSRGALTVPSCC